MSQNLKILTATVFPEDKEAIDRIAKKNRITRSYVVRVLLHEELAHIRERELFRTDLDV